MRDLNDARRAGHKVPFEGEPIPTPKSNGASKNAGSQAKDNDKPGPVITTYSDLMARDLPPVEYLLEPWFRVGGRCLLFGPPGLGKTMVSLAIAIAVATGTKLFSWQAAKPRRVLYVDGELGFRDTIERLPDLLIAVDAPSPGENLAFLSYEENVIASLATTEGQEFVDKAIADYRPDLVVVDNVSCLCQTDDENSSSSWQPINDWIIRLRRRNVAILLDHHSGASGERQRGTSAREAVMDVCLSLRRRSGAVDASLDATLHWTKARALRSGTEPIDVAFRSGEDGRPTWFCSKSSQRDDEAINDLADSGMSERQIAKALGLTSSKVHRTLARNRAPA